ncbi:uncharacterized protein [Nicotiana tomentosiformis]|uniref:uncharacterized protein n=1 Tax=Nicotiana tomentosiformis TaxID=4098 RepID=UPI00051AE252|nr:uncharacterized protein LOC104089194 [Nicotiana tomentosiformis]
MPYNPVLKFIVGKLADRIEERGKTHPLMLRFGKFVSEKDAKIKTWRYKKPVKPTPIHTVAAKSSIAVKNVVVVLIPTLTVMLGQKLLWNTIQDEISNSQKDSESCFSSAILKAKADMEKQARVLIREELAYQRQLARKGLISILEKNLPVLSMVLKDVLDLEITAGEEPVGEVQETTEEEH